MKIRAVCFLAVLLITTFAAAFALAADDRSMPKQPQWRVATPDGEVAAQGAFEYG